METSICDSVIYSAIVVPVHQAHELLFHRQPSSLYNVSIA